MASVSSRSFNTTNRKGQPRFRVHTGRNSVPWRARAPLSERFEKNDASGDGNVEGFYGASGRERDDEIAPLARQFMQALALAAEDDPHRRGVVHFSVILVALLIEAHKASSQLPLTPPSFARDWSPG